MSVAFEPFHKIAVFGHDDLGGFFCGQKNLIVLATFRVGDVLANGFGAVKVFNMASLTLTDVPEDLRAQLENEALATGPESPVTEKEMDAIRDRVLKRKAA